MTITYTGDKPHHTDYRPYRALAAAVVIHALEDLAAEPAKALDAAAWLIDPHSTAEIFFLAAGLDDPRRLLKQANIRRLRRLARKGAKQHD